MSHNITQLRVANIQYSLHYRDVQRTLKSISLYVYIYMVTREAYFQVYMGQFA